jgi:hypothetical protein
MITYFYLSRTDSERLHGDSSISYRNHEYFPCPITTKHLDGSRRIGPLFLQMEHNRREELIIWSY